MSDENSSTPAGNDPVTPETKIPTTDTPVSEVPTVPGEAIAPQSAGESVEPGAPAAGTTESAVSADEVGNASSLSSGIDQAAEDADGAAVPLEKAVAVHLEAIFKLVADAFAVKAAAATGAVQSAHDTIVDIEDRIQNGRDVGSHEVMSLVSNLRLKLREMF
ncbi:hypothetical protein ACQUFY_11995 [Robbsia andropogonis]|uniref:hypothetical protein n=1 Tax=Robbsia andropogonis TaxID=28092 RepID=UPI003D1C10FC